MSLQLNEPIWGIRNVEEVASSSPALTLDKRTVNQMFRGQKALRIGHQ